MNPVSHQQRGWRREKEALRWQGRCCWRCCAVLCRKACWQQPQCTTDETRQHMHASGRAQLLNVPCHAPPCHRAMPFLIIIMGGPEQVTPFLLERIRDLTGGRSLQANILLVKNNAAVGAQIAAAYHRGQGRGQGADGGGPSSRQGIPARSRL